MVIESYSTTKGGTSLDALKAELESQGCEIIKIETSTMVPVCEGHSVLGDCITVRRYSKEERMAHKNRPY